MDWCPMWWPSSWMYVASSVECCWSNHENNEGRTQNLLKFAGVPVPQTCQLISAVSGRSSPYCEVMWRRYCCLTSFFSDCRYVPQLQTYSLKSYVMVLLILPFPQIDIIGAMVIVWKVTGKIIGSVLCSIVCNNSAQCNAHTYEQT